MQTLQITLRNAQGTATLSEANAAAALPCVFTVGRVVRFAGLDIPGTDVNGPDVDEVYGRVTVPFNPVTSRFTVEIDDSEVLDGFVIRDCNLQCPSCEHCCGVFAETASGAPIEGHGSAESPLIIPWPVDEGFTPYDPDGDGNPVIPRLIDQSCDFQTVQVPECGNSVVLEIGCRPLGVLDAAGEWGLSIVQFNPASGAVVLSGKVPENADISIIYSCCEPPEEEEEEEGS